MIIDLDLNNLKPNIYSESGMDKLISDILLSANTEFLSANRSSKFCFKKAETIEDEKKKESWKERGYGYANEIANVLHFIISDWYLLLTSGDSPQKTIYNKMLKRVNYYVRSYVKEQVEYYAKKKNINLEKLYDK